MERKIIALARQVIAREPPKRPEAGRIQEWALRLAETEGIRSMAELDQLIYAKMYGEFSSKSETLKIRYWRTGRHLPLDREEALAFARALELDADEVLYLLQAVMEKSDRVFFGEEPLECRKWMLEQLRALDAYLWAAGRHGYRFLHFRSLETMARY